MALAKRLIIDIFVPKNYQALFVLIGPCIAVVIFAVSLSGVLIVIAFLNETLFVIEKISSFFPR